MKVLSDLAVDERDILDLLCNEKFTTDDQILWHGFLIINKSTLFTAEQSDLPLDMTVVFSQA